MTSRHRYHFGLVCVMLATVLFPIHVAMELSEGDVSARQIIVEVALLLMVIVGWSLIPNLKRRADREEEQTAKISRRLKSLDAPDDESDQDQTGIITGKKR